MRKAEKIRRWDESAFAAPRSRAQSLEDKEKPQFRSERHLAWLRTLPCRYCDLKPTKDRPTQACHLRFRNDGAKGVKPSDFWCWAGCLWCHDIQGHEPEMGFHRRQGVADPHRMVLETYALKSPCPKTVEAARAEWERRGYV